MINILGAMKNDRLMKAITGLSVKEFKLLVPDFANNLNRFFKKNRKIDPTRGREFLLKTVDEKLFYILFYCKCYPTFDVASFFFNADRASCCRWVHWFMKALEMTLGEKCVLPERKLKNPEDVLRIVPEIKEIYIDGTERPIRRPYKNSRQKEFYSGKKKRHTMKNLVVADKKKKIIVITKTGQGKSHDYQTFKDERIASGIPDGVDVFVDNGFQGIQTDFPDLNIHMPKRKPKGKELSKHDKKGNTAISRKRILIEHVIGGIKRLRCVADVYRNIKQNFEDLIMLVAAGLWNYHLMKA